MKWTIAAPLCLTLTIGISGQATSTGQLPPLPVFIESWRYDPSLKAVILHLVNHSNKDVTAFNISIAEKY